MKILAAVALSLLSSTAFAGQILGGRIADIRVDASGLGIVRIEGTKTGGAACGAPIPDGFAFSTKTEGGRALLTTLLAAQLANRMLNVFGSNVCSLYGTNVEDIQFIQVD